MDMGRNGAAPIVSPCMHASAPCEQLISNWLIEWVAGAFCLYLVHSSRLDVGGLMSSPNGMATIPMPRSDSRAVTPCNSHWIHVTVPHRGVGGDGPPEGCDDVGKRFWLRFVFDLEHEDAGDDHNEHRHEKRGKGVQLGVRGLTFPVGAWIGCVGQSSKNCRISTTERTCRKQG